MKFNDKITKKCYSLQMIALKIFFLRIYSQKKTNLLPQFAHTYTERIPKEKIVFNIKNYCIRGLKNRCLS